MNQKSLQRIQEKLTSVQLVPQIQPTDKQFENKPYYTSLVTDPQGRTCFFKASITEDETVLDTLAKEIAVLKQIDTLKNGNHVEIPRMIKGRATKHFVWHVREYLEGTPLGTWHTGFTKDILENQQYAKKLALGIYYLQMNLLTLGDSRTLPTRKCEPIQKYTNALAQEAKSARLIDEKTAQRIEKKVAASCPQETLVFNHGMLLPEKILAKKQTVCLIDWRSATMSNPAFDIGTVWAYAVRNPEWQKAFVEAYLNLSTNGAIVVQYLEMEKIRQLLTTLLKFKHESRISHIKGEKKKFYTTTKKTLLSLL